MPYQGYRGWEAMGRKHNISVAHSVTGEEIWDLYVPLKGFTIKKNIVLKEVGACLPACILKEVLSYAYYPEEEEKEGDEVLKWSLQYQDKAGLLELFEL